MKSVGFFFYEARIEEQSRKTEKRRKHETKILPYLGERLKNSVLRFAVAEIISALSSKLTDVVEKDILSASSDAAPTSTSPSS